MAACAAAPPQGAQVGIAGAAPTQTAPGGAAGAVPPQNAQDGTAGAAPSSAARPITLAVRIVPSSPATPPGADLPQAIRGGRFVRRLLPRLPGLRLELGAEAGGPIGDIEVLAGVLPAPALVEAARAAGLPLALAGGAIELDGRRYGEPAQAVAARLPASPELPAAGPPVPSEVAWPAGQARRRAESSRPAWLVAGMTVKATAALVDELLPRLAAAQGAFGERRDRGAPVELDYLVRETPRLERRGRWLLQERGAAIDRAADRDELGERDADLAALRPIAGVAGVPGERVELLVAARDRQRPELVRLAAELDRAAAAMAARVPLAPTRPMRPIVVALEPDHVAQARHAGEIGAAVRSEAGDAADLRLVYHPDDLFADRFALAQVLVERSGLGLGLRPWLARGAALWLAGDWYGRPYADWIPWLAAAGALPEAAELLAAEPAGDASAVLWTPVAAALVARLPGDSLRAKLRPSGAAAAGPGLEEAAAAAWLSELAGAGANAGSAASVGPGGNTASAADARGASGGEPAAASAPPAPAALPFLRGVSLAMENSVEGGYHAPALDLQLTRLAGLGVDAVSLMPFAFQAAADDPRLHFLNGGPASETDAGLIHAVRAARAHGLVAFYKPHVWIGGGSWPGDVAMRDEAGWRLWWRGYRRYILHHAVLARWAHAGLFSVGVELSRTVERLAEWRQLIAAARQVFPGRLTYSGNWSGDLERVRFWDRLDLIGVDAYYPLASGPRASRGELMRGADAVAARLAAASRAWRRPLLLTEVGFAASRAAWTAPHREGGELSEADQAAAYDAFFRALGRPSWLAGTFVWKAFSGEGGRHHRTAADFRFLGRPAEAVIARYYKQP